MDSYKKSKNSLRKHKNIYLRKLFWNLQANIPVQNGIVHLIDKPLVILTSSLWDSIDPANQVTVHLSNQDLEPLFFPVRFKHSRKIPEKFDFFGPFFIILSGCANFSSASFCVLRPNFRRLTTPTRSSKLIDCLGEQAVPAVCGAGRRKFGSEGANYGGAVRR